jgi:molybdopterin converting factor small subunit
VTISLRLFAAARVAAGRGEDTFDLPDGATVADVLAAAVVRYGEPFADVLSTARVWINGDEPAGGTIAPVRGGDEVAVLPPVSGG